MTTTTPAEVWPVATFLIEEMETRRWTPSVVAKQSGRVLTVESLRLILDGAPVTPYAAVGLATAFGTSAEFWINLDAAYWSALERELTSQTVAAREGGLT